MVAMDGALNLFPEYLGSLPDALLLSVASDYVWLATQFQPEDCRTDFAARRQLCFDECVRRGHPELYRQAEAMLGPQAA